MSAPPDDLSVPKHIGSGIELLADPTRRRIIGLLAVRALRPSTIAAEIGLSRPAVSRQRLLREAGLIERTRSFIDRRALVYRIPHWQLGPITAWLAGTSVGRPIDVTWDEEGVPRQG